MPTEGQALGPLATACWKLLYGDGDEADETSLSIRELKQELGRRGIDCGSCVANCSTPEEARAAEEARPKEISKGSDLFREIASLAETSKLPFEDACELTVTAVLQVGPTARTNEELQFHGTPPDSIRRAASALDPL